jgi:hypothetical protein
LPVVPIYRGRASLISTPNHRQIPPIPCPREGRLRDRHGRWCGMRWTRAMSATNDVDPRTVKSCGPDAPTLASSSREAKLLGEDGGKKARSPGSSKEAVKTIAQGRPGETGEPVVTTLVCFFNSHARLRVHWAPGFPCGLQFSRAWLANLGRIVSRECGGVSGAPRRSNLPPCLYSSYPPPGLAFGEPDDRLQRGIQYAAPSRVC